MAMSKRGPANTSTRRQTARDEPETGVTVTLSAPTSSLAPSSGECLANTPECDGRSSCFRSGSVRRRGLRLQSRLARTNVPLPIEVRQILIVVDMRVCVF